MVRQGSLFHVDPSLDPCGLQLRAFLCSFTCYVLLRTLVSHDVHVVITKDGIVGVPLKGWGK